MSRPPENQEIEVMGFWSRKQGRSGRKVRPSRRLSLEGLETRELMTTGLLQWEPTVADRAEPAPLNAATIAESRSTSADRNGLPGAQFFQRGGAASRVGELQDSGASRDSSSSSTSGAPSRVAQVRDNSRQSARPYDLAATSVRVHETSAPYGSTITITASVRNNGTRTINGYRVSFHLNNLRNTFGPQIDQDLVRNVNLRPGRADTFTVTVRLEASSDSGVHYIPQYVGMKVAADRDTRTSNNDVVTSGRLQVLRPSQPPSDSFDSEPNNSRSQADFIASVGRGSFNRTYYGHVGNGSDSQDWYRIRLGGTTRGTIRLEGMRQDLDLALYSASGRLISSSVRSGSQSDQINLNRLPAGDYYIRVFRGVSNARSEYALRFNLNVS